VLEPLPRLMVFNASFLISREEHNNWLYLNRVNIFYSIFILMRFKSLFKNFPNCGWFWIKTDLHFWAKKTCIVVSAFVGIYTSWSEFDEFWPPETIRKFKKTLNIETIHYQHWSTIQLWDSTPIIWRVSSFILAPEVIGVLATRYCALFFIFYAI